MKSITIAITSCGRISLLKKTIKSLSQSIDFSKYDLLITEDTKNIDIIKKMKKENNSGFLQGRKILYTGDIKISNPFESHKRALEILYENITTEYTFHCEDDWYFKKTDYDYLELSKEILEYNKNIGIIGLRDRYQKTEYNFLLTDIEIKNKHFTNNYENYFGFNFVRLSPIGPGQEPFLLNPGLRRTNQAKEVIYSYKGRLDEYFNGKVYADMGLYTINILPGIYRHIGGGFKSTSFFKDGFIKSITRAIKNAYNYYINQFFNK